MKRRFSAVLALSLVLSSGPLSTPVEAGIPVFDGLDIVQSILTVVENVAQTLKQIQEYRTQLQQYENMLQNTLQPSYLWDDAQSTINGLLNATNTLNYYKRQLGSIDAYLSKYQDVDYYRNSSCFQNAGCSDAERAALEANRSLASQSQKKANDALFKGLDLQQTNLQNDSRRLEELQSNAQGASGQMEALGAANQLAGQQANQLLQIRALLIAQQNATASRMQAQSDKEAQTTAADEQFRRGSFRPSTGKAY